MGKSYSSDLRDRAIALVDAGRSPRAAARHFGVGASFAMRLMQRVRRPGTAAPARRGHPPGESRLDAYEAFLVGTVEAGPDITMPELASTQRW